MPYSGRFALLLDHSDQQSARMITNRLHRERPTPGLVPEHLTRGKTSLRLVCMEFDGDLAAHAVSPPYNSNDGLCVYRSLRVALRLTCRALSGDGHRDRGGRACRRR